MRKTLFTFLFITCVVLSFTFTAVAQDVLYDQTGNPSADEGLISQDFVNPGDDAFDSQGADDFEVPSGETWIIEQVLAIGTYALGTGTASGFNIFFYANNNGILPGTEIYSALNLAYTDNGAGSFTVTLSTPIVLTEGNYWVSVQSILDSALWAWTVGLGPNLDPAAWQNPSDGWVLGATTYTNAQSLFNFVGSELEYALLGTNIGATIDLSHTVTYASKTNPSDYNSSEYRIVGLPGASDLSVSSILTGTQGSDWEVYWDNGSASDFFVKFNSSNPFRFSTGRSYWIIRKGNLNINLTVPSAEINSSLSVDISLESQNGFNLITNPFDEPIPWAVVQTLNGISVPIHSFTGGWSESTNFEPYTGYLFDNSADNKTVLKIPLPQSVSPSSLEKVTDQTIWRVSIDLSCGEYFDQTTSFGISQYALDGRDKLDFRKPRGIGKIPVAYFYHPDWDDGYGIFATDIRPEFEEEQTWDLKVYSELRETEKLTFSGIEKISGEMEIYLVDKDRAKYLNLREKSEYEFIPVKNVSDFQILVGKMEKINSKLNNLIPSEFALGNNFPNPFNPVTTIPLSVPQSAEIRLVIYNILGQEVKVLFNGTVEAGKHWYVWDGKDDQGFTVPSGIYVYNFISGASINISKKMILMK